MEERIYCDLLWHSLDCWKLAAWREGSFVCFMSPGGVPFRLSVADERRMIGLVIPGLILVNYRRTDSGFFCRESINRGRFRFDAPQMSNTSIPTHKKISFPYPE